MEQQKPKRIPYGMQNWEDVRLYNYYYVDKTLFIPEIEASNNFFFFIRPRRFGKSLLMNMLRQYYDVRKATFFERLFGDLWIGQHPTDAHNTYLVLYLNFAAFSGGLEGYKERMDGYCRIQFEGFLRDYEDMLPENALEILQSEKGAANQLSALVRICNESNLQIYLFIDEYDHFTNAILSDPGTELGYKSETHGTGAFRAFFDAIKAGTDGAIKRLFVTGVSPVTMDDLTSGFNIGTNYTMHPKFNALVGFTEEEVREMLEYYRQYFPFHHTTDELLDIMRPWYDNYCFSVKCLDEPPMYNSDMVLYFVYSYIDANGRLPDNMLDTNIRTDYSKLRMLIRKDRGFQHDASIIQHIVETGGITAKLKDSFPSQAITQPDNFVSLLYYFGMLTIAGNGGIRGIKFRIPNQVVREQIYDYLTETYRDNELSIDDWQRSYLQENMAIDGDWLPFFENMSVALKRFASQRDLQKGEAFVHGFTLSQTCMGSFYLPISELDAGVKSHTPLPNGEPQVGGYADIYLQPMLGIYPDIEHSYVLELKYLPSKATDAEVADARETAIGQLTRYARSVAVERTIGHTRLHRLILVWRGMNLAVAEEL
ncbi:MAG: AAA family ATPase [Prevotella sp.]|nr:AAA family ATPase [Prevotella sp.]